MSKLLVTPKASVPLDRVRIASFKPEDNAAQGRRWVEIWAVLGRRQIEDDDTTFQQFVDPETGNDVYQYIKIENAMHPLAPGTMLSKCPDCDTWAQQGAGTPCAEEGCSGSLVAYDGATRWHGYSKPGAVINYDSYKQLIYEFCMAEMVPHPVTWEMVRLLDAQEG